MLVYIETWELTRCGLLLYIHVQFLVKWEMQRQVFHCIWWFLLAVGARVCVYKRLFWHEGVDIAMRNVQLGICISCSLWVLESGRSLSKSSSTCLYIYSVIEINLPSFPNVAEGGLTIYCIILINPLLLSLYQVVHIVSSFHGHVIGSSHPAINPFRLYTNNSKTDYVEKAIFQRYGNLLVFHNRVSAKVYWIQRRQWV